MAAGQAGFFDPTLEPAPKPLGRRRLSVLITVKAAPNPSATYGETVCVAGVSTDLTAPGWIRLYPVNFRDLDATDQFRKYDMIQVEATPAPNDPRSESWRPVLPTLAVIKHLPPWAKRRPLIDPYVEDSMCALNGASLLPGSRSLGAIRVRDVIDLVVERHPGWSADEQKKIDGYVNQLDMFAMTDKTALEAPRFKARYFWRCCASGCKGHKQGVLDWELVALQRNLHDASDEEMIRKLKERFLDGICAPGKDLAFYVGNQAKHHNVFSVLGAYYPPSPTTGRRSLQGGDDYVSMTTSMISLDAKDSHDVRRRQTT